MKRQRALWIVVVVALFWFFRPFWHPLWVLTIAEPLWLLIPLIIWYCLWRLIPSLRAAKVVQTGPASYGLKSDKPLTGKAVASIVILLAVVGFIMPLQDAWRLSRTATTDSFAERTTIPTISPIRIIPAPVADRYAQDSFQNPQEHLGASQLTLVDGKLERVYPRVPDGWLLYFVRKMTGFVTVQADTFDRNVTIVDQTFKYADGIGITDNLYYQLNLKRFNVEYSAEPTYLKDDTGQWVTVVPYMGFKGSLVRTPFWAGVMVVKSDGQIIDYSPEQAQAVSYLKGNRLYPKELAAYYTQATAYKDGILNAWFLHKDQTEVVQLPSDDLVIHAATTEGLKQIVVAEPYGRSFGIYKIFLIDATTGKREVVSYDQNSQLTGPIAAADYIRREFPTYDWNRFTLAEPRPLTVNGQLNWLLSVVPSDYAGIATTVALDAHTNKVVKIADAPALNAFLAGQTTAEATSTDRTTQLKTSVDNLQKELDALKTLVNTP